MSERACESQRKTLASHRCKCSENHRGSRQNAHINERVFNLKTMRSPWIADSWTTRSPRRDCAQHPVSDPKERLFIIVVIIFGETRISLPSGCRQWNVFANRCATFGIRHPRHLTIPHPVVGCPETDHRYDLSLFLKRKNTTSQWSTDYALTDRGRMTDQAPHTFFVSFPLCQSRRRTAAPESYLSA